MLLLFFTEGKWQLYYSTIAIVVALVVNEAALAALVTSPAPAVTLAKLEMSLETNDV